MSIFSKIFGDENEKFLKELEPTVKTINAFEDGISQLSDQELKDKTKYFKEQLKEGKTLDNILPEAFAVVREAAKRTLGQRHYDVQLIGGIVLHQGKIAEMKTGEGKTLVATLPVYLNALNQKGVHVVTVNDYLSRRDAVWMGQIYSFLGLSVGVINDNEQFLYDSEHLKANEAIEADEERDELGSFKVKYEFLRPCSKKEAYDADITYGTNSQFGFDYLRDNIEYTKNNLRQKEHQFAIVDEIDSILIDEARTPLIISAPAQDSEKLYGTFAEIAQKLKEGEDYEIEEKHRAITLKDSGIEKAEKILGFENIYTDAGIKYVHHLETAVRAKALFHNDKDYVVRNGEIVIVDQFTGRMQPGRRWSEGLHQAIEAKEGLEVQQESRTYASITYQNFFRMYKKLSGMTGTAKSSDEEFRKVYGLDTIVIPTNKPIARIDRNDLIFQTELGKFKAIARKIKELNSTGQPVLIGTVTIEKSELLSDFLKKEGVPHTVLNAKKHESEGEVIAQAGKKGAVTIATNMAGRGVDIKLGGSPSTKEQYEEIKDLGGLFVLGTERHEARRIDDQLRGRSGRQGDPGETQFFVSMEDSLMRIFASDTIKNMMGRMGLPEDMPIEAGVVSKSLESAQTKIEGFNFDARKHVLEYDDVLNTQRNAVYDRRMKVLTSDSSVIEEELAFLSAGDESIENIIKEKREILGEEEFLEVIRRLILQTIDMYWIEHLELMDYVRSSVRLRAYGQRDPLIEYKKEGLRLFNEMQEGINAQILKTIPNIGAGAFAKEEEKMKEIHAKAKAIGEEGSSTPIKTEDKVGRNDPCPCGSGKKYKKCHGA
ncbi:MAG: preprotein translocase subunit SecA [Candidatus Levybacteria bacterium CG10_big_fil_rev_8_21_14_0_10_36_7]|nr:MAG: preprotein translocase subunit SecA [Candidatus Levybacteria bacterium CG10_big_fil_rev_8_21_14_0_10_36_7]